MERDNPAARLLAILLKGKGISESVQCKSAWLEIFNLTSRDLTDQSLLMSKLAQTMLLAHETKTLVEQFFPSQAESLNYTFSRIESAFTSQNISDKWTSFIRYIDQHCINTLSMTAELLNHRLQTKQLEDNQLNAFRSKVDNLIKETLNSELTDEFKRFMVHYLRKILDSIDDYSISGAMPILTSVEATIGHAVLDPNFREELTSTETGNKIRDMLGDLANIVTVATAATGAAAHIASSAGLPFLG